MKLRKRVAGIEATGEVFDLVPLMHDPGIEDDHLDVGPDDIALWNSRGGTAALLEDGDLPWAGSSP